VPPPEVTAQDTSTRTATAWRVPLSTAQ
jgi:hypothetical protein